MSASNRRRHRRCRSASTWYLFTATARHNAPHRAATRRSQKIAYCETTDPTAVPVAAATPPPAAVCCCLRCILLILFISFNIGALKSVAVLMPFVDKNIKMYILHCSAPVGCYLNRISYPIRSYAIKPTQALH